jgi:membrane fusion protein (multidrug efflux system)
MKLTTLTVALWTLVAPVVLSGCNTGDASQVAELVTPAAAAVPVRVRLPERTDLFATYETTANIDTDGDAPVVARVEGDVVELLVEEGASVEAGQALAQLDGERLRLEMLAAKADVDRVEGEYRRYEDLHRRGLVSKAMYDNLKYDLDALRATHKLRALEYGYATIRAPIAGIVSSRSIRPGEHLKLNQEAFRITETRELLADLQVPQTELRRIATGQTAKLTVDALPGREFPAEIVRLSPTIDVRSGTFRATARIDNASGDLAPGMFARFSIAYEMHPDALVIPKSALIEEDEETAVYVVVGDAVEKRVIGTGIQAGGRVEVLEGLGESDQVVVNGQGALRDGSKVLAQLGDQERFSG